MWQYYCALFSAAWHSMLADGSSTRYSMLALSVGAAVGSSVLTLFVEWMRNGRTMNSFTSAWRQWPTYVIPPTTVILLWLCTYAIDFIHAPFMDHQAVATGQIHLQTERDDWKRKFNEKPLLGNVLSNPAPHAAINAHPTILPAPAPIPAPSSEWYWTRPKENDFVAEVKTAPALFVIEVAHDDGESFRFGMEVQELLKSAGWTPSSAFVIHAVWAGRFQGVVIHVSHQDFPAAANLAAPFQGRGLDAKAQLDTSVPPNAVQIDVGYRPDYWKP